MSWMRLLRWTSTITLTADAGVWLYKPYSDVVEPPSGEVSEPATLALFFAALGVMMWAVEMASSYKLKKT